MIPMYGLLDAHMFLDSNMCFYLNCWNVYMAPQRVINISKSSKNEGPLWPHTPCFDSVFQMSQSNKAEQSAFSICPKAKKQWNKILPQITSICPFTTNPKQICDFCYLSSPFLPHGKLSWGTGRGFWNAQVMISWILTIINNAK